jgi:hypothetical protein
MILHVLAGAASDRSWADWGYDVSKNVASAAFVALLVAVVGKKLGWGAVARVRWRFLLAVAMVYGLAVVAVVAADRLGLALGSSVFTAILVSAMLGLFEDRKKWLRPPPPAESYWDWYWASKRGHH